MNTMSMKRLGHGREKRREFGHKQGTGAWSLEFESFCFLCVTQAGPVVYAGEWHPREHIPGNTVDIFYFSFAGSAYLQMLCWMRVCFEFVSQFWST